MKVNELNITIKKALIEEVHLSLKEDGLEVYIKGGMYTAHGKKVSEFTYSSEYYGDNKFNVPLAINRPAREIFEMLTPVLYEKINGEYKYLGKGKNANAKKT